MSVMQPVCYWCGWLSRESISCASRKDHAIAERKAAAVCGAALHKPPPPSVAYMLNTFPTPRTTPGSVIILMHIHSEPWQCHCKHLNCGITLCAIVLSLEMALPY